MFFTSILLVALAIMSRGAIDTNARLYTSQVEQATSALDAARDSVVIESVTPGSPAEDLTLVLRNDGKRDIANWASIDLIIVYTAAFGPITESLSLAADNVVAGTWSPLAGDVYEPGILNLDEIIELRAFLSNAPQAGSDGRILITLQGGAPFSRAFAFP